MLGESGPSGPQHSSAPVLGWHVWARLAYRGLFSRQIGLNLFHKQTELKYRSAVTPYELCKKVIILVGSGSHD